MFKSKSPTTQITTHWVSQIWYLHFIDLLFFNRTKGWLDKDLPKTNWRKKKAIMHIWEGFRDNTTCTWTVSCLHIKKFYHTKCDLVQLERLAVYLFTSVKGNNLPNGCCNQFITIRHIEHLISWTSITVIVQLLSPLFIL